VTKPKTISELIKYCLNGPKAYAERMLLFLVISIIYGFLAIVIAYLAKGDLNV
jgi:hypothetical protein